MGVSVMTNDREVLMKENLSKKSGFSAFFSSVSACFIGFAEFFKPYSIHKACKQGDSEKLKQLLKTIKNREELNQLDEVGVSPLHYAVRNYSFGCAELLLKHGAEPNIYSCTGSMTRTPLHDAAYNQSKELVDLLVKYGAKSTCSDENGFTPFGLPRTQHFSLSQ